MSVLLEKVELTDRSVDNITLGSKVVGGPLKITLSSGRSYISCETEEYCTVSDLSQESRDAGHNLEDNSFEEEFTLIEIAALEFFKASKNPYRTSDEYDEIIKDLKESIKS